MSRNWLLNIQTVSYSIQKHNQILSSLQRNSLPCLSNMLLAKNALLLFCLLYKVIQIQSNVIWLNMRFCSSLLERCLQRSSFLDSNFFWTSWIFTPQKWTCVFLTLWSLTLPQTLGPLSTISLVFAFIWMRKSNIKLRFYSQNMKSTCLLIPVYFPT